MSDIKLPQGSDYHGNGKYYTKKNTTTKLTLQIGMLERQLKDAWERNEVQNKYWHNIATERNTLKEKYAELEEHHATNLVERNSYLLETEILKNDIKELETELYFCNRNKRVGEIVDG